MFRVKGLIGLVGIGVLIACLGCTLMPQRQRADVPVMDGVMHTTAEGESLGAIARTYSVSVPLLQRVNNVEDPNQIPPGTRLFIPGATEILPVQVETATAPAEERNGLYHPVGPGETLSAIAMAYDITQRELQEANNLQDPNQIQTGDRIWIPRATEVQDVDVPKVTIVSPDPFPTPKEEPRVIVKVQPTPKATATPKAATKEVDFPRAVSTPFGSIRFQWPLKDTFRILQPYNPSQNYGIDLGADIGTPVYAAADGVVVLVGGVSDDLGSQFGNYIILFHGEEKSRGIRTIYAHNSENLVEIGKKVKRGDPIAKVGNTGRTGAASGGVLHFEVRNLDQPVDPTKVLPPL